MNPYLIDALRASRKAYLKLSGQKRLNSPDPDVLDKTAAATLISEKLLGDAPVMIARLGAVELSSVANFRSIQKGGKYYLEYIKGKSEAFWWDRNTMFLMANNAGFFPANPHMLEKFALQMVEDMKLVDVLGSWLWQETLFAEELSAAAKIRLLDLEPYNHERPWSLALKGKKVLVVHPFAESIAEQYKKREVLFGSKDVLPDFQLTTIKAVQSIANNKTSFENWFDALAYMKDKISNTDFDIAIIGCGAYGFPLAAHVKRIGKKAVHLGGATQTLFGIAGKRWETSKEHSAIAAMMNEHWTKPKLSETPEGIQSVEGACYW